MRLGRAGKAPDPSRVCAICGDEIARMEQAYVYGLAEAHARCLQESPAVWLVGALLRRERRPYCRSCLAAKARVDMAELTVALVAFRRSGMAHRGRCGVRRLRRSPRGLRSAGRLALATAGMIVASRVQEAEAKCQTRPTS
jgi:hypothetical protein